MSDIPTLGDTAAAGDALGLTLTCPQCGRGVSLPIKALVNMLGTDYPEIRSGARFSCDRSAGGCGARGPQAGWKFREKPPIDWAARGLLAGARQCTLGPEEILEMKLASARDFRKRRGKR